MDIIKNYYGGLIDLIGFIVGHTSDHGADIAIRALPILSPMPNAIGMYYVSMTVLGFGHWQALAFALAIEFALFGLFEVALMMFDGIQVDERRYRWPFILSLAVAIIVMALIIIVVYQLETVHPILAALPLFSAAGAVALALRRWHARNSDKRSDAFQVEQARNVQLMEQIERMKVERLIELERMEDEQDAERFAEQERIIQLEQALNELRIESAILSERLSAKTTIVPGVSNESKPTEIDTDKRRTIVLDFYRNNPGVPYQVAADALGVPKTSVYNDVKFWEKRGMIHVNGNGVEVKQ